jgi:hypothetical protein
MSLGTRSYWILVLVYVVVLLSVQPFLGYGIDFFKETWGEAALNRTAYVLVAFGAIIMVAIGSHLWRRTTARDRGLIVVSLLLYVAGTLTARFPQERLHYLGYGLLAGLLYAGWKGAAGAPTATIAGRKEWLRPALLAILVGSAIGLLDELLQILWPRRYFDWADVSINVLSVAVGVMVAIPVVNALLRDRVAEDQR